MSDEMKSEYDIRGGVRGKYLTCWQRFLLRHPRVADIIDYLAVLYR